MTRAARRLALATTLLLAAHPAAADFRAGMEAYTAGDFETAYREWLPLAGEGSAVAQFNVALMLDLGQGRERNAAAAFDWYLRSAEGGFERAQFRLGEMYEAGEGVEQDLVQARKWFFVLAESRYGGAKKRMKKVAATMTAQEIALGDMWARAFLKAQKDKKKKKR